MNLLSTHLRTALDTFIRLKSKLPEFDKSVAFIVSRMKTLGVGLILVKFCIVVKNENYMLKTFSVTSEFEKQYFDGKIFAEHRYGFITWGLQ